MSIKPKLSRFDLTMIVISLVIGMGIFGTPSDVATRAGSTPIFFAAWIFGGLVTLCGALTFAEIGARYPTTGGFYKVFSYCYHPAFAFMINWVLVISNAASVAAVALLGSEYISPLLLPQSLQNSTGTKITTIAMVLLLYVINFLGIKMSARAQNVLTIFKVGMILLLCTAIFRHDYIPSEWVVTPHQGNLITAFGLSLVPVFFTYTGYAQTINFGGDIINAKKNIPRSIFIGIGTVIALYLAINYVYFSVLGLGGLQHTHTLAAAMSGVIFGATGAKVTSILTFVSVVAYVNVNILSSPRVYYAMAEDGILPAIFKKINPKTQVQEFGMSFFVAAILVILFFVSSFSDMLNYVMFFEIIGVTAAAISIFILRKKTRDLDIADIYTIKWFPLVPVVFILSYCFVILNIFISFKESPYAALFCLAAYALGLGIYYISVKKKWEAA
jgi:APA family basic amino acid/polyamine antiporter